MDNFLTAQSIYLKSFLTFTRILLTLHAYFENQIPPKMKRCEILSKRHYSTPSLIRPTRNPSTPLIPPQSQEQRKNPATNLSGFPGPMNLLEHRLCELAQDRIAAHLASADLLEAAVEPLVVRHRQNHLVD